MLQCSMWESACCCVRVNVCSAMWEILRLHVIWKSTCNVGEYMLSCNDYPSVGVQHSSASIINLYFTDFRLINSSINNSIFHSTGVLYKQLLACF